VAANKRPLNKLLHETANKFVDALSKAGRLNYHMLYFIASDDPVFLDQEEPDNCFFPQYQQ
jgi:hypothetical protein